MSARALALRWSIDGPLGLALSLLLVASACLYVLAARAGQRADRRGRSWPRQRTLAFLAGLGLLAVDLYSGLGTESDVRLSAHMLQHMVMWLGVAPLLVAGAPVRLALFALARDGRQVLARWLHARAVVLVTGPVGATALFCGVLAISHLPAVYALAEANPYVHAAEHLLYVLTAVLVWAPALGVDPLPHRAGPRARIACVIVCQLLMALIAIWLAVAPRPVYAHYAHALGPGALDDQRRAALVMASACLPALVLPLGRHLTWPWRRMPHQSASQRTAA